MKDEAKIPIFNTQTHIYPQRKIVGFDTFSSKHEHDKTKSTKNNRCKTYYTIKITLGNNKKTV